MSEALNDSARQPRNAVRGQVAVLGFGRVCKGADGGVATLEHHIQPTVIVGPFPEAVEHPQNVAMGELRQGR